MSDSERRGKSPHDSIARQIPRPNVRAGRDADETADEDLSSAYCEGCDRHLPHGVPDIGRAVADNDGQIPACARPECDGADSRSVEFSSYTVAALSARRRSRTAKGGTRQ